MSAAKTSDTKKKEQNLPRAPKGTRLPALWEVVSTFSNFIITLLGVSVFVVSYINGASFIWCAIRAGSAMLAVGLVLWLFYWMIARGSLDLAGSLLKERQDEINAQSAADTTREYNG